MSYKLYTDKNESFECEVAVKNASLKGSMARLVVESADGPNLIFHGKIENGKSAVDGAVATAVTAYTANTASYITASNVDGAVTIAVTAYTANTASYALTTPTSIFSRGGTLFNASNIPNSTQWVPVWRAPFNCTASAFNTVANVGNVSGVASASVNARRNSTLTLLSSSYPITASSTYVALGSAFLQNQLFSTGDDLEIGFIGTTGSVQSINVQIDFNR